MPDEPLPPSDSALVGGRYRIGDVLGRGAMGEVRDAVDERLHRPVALKVLLPALAGDEGARRRFEDEARTAARLVHPNAVAVFDSGEHDGTPYIVLERLPGRTLADELRTGPLPPDAVRRLAAEVLAALGAAHEAGIVHRDVKPGNILLTDDGTAKVADFGIAKTAEGLDHTATGLVIGTPSYLAPERAAGAPATAASDLYAVAVVLHEALTGARPPPLGSPLPAPPPAADDLLRAIASGLSTAPEDRPPSAAAFAAALAARPGDDATRGTTPDATVVVGATGGATAVAADPGTPPAPAAVPRAPSVVLPPPPADARRPRPDPRLVVAALVAVVVGVLVVVATGGDGSGDGDGVPTLPEPLESRLRELEEAIDP